MLGRDALEHAVTSSVGDQPRSGKGVWIKGRDSVARDREAFIMRSNGQTLREIAERLGYGNESNVRRAIRKAMEKYERPAIEDLRTTMDQQLETLYRKAMDVLEARHLVFYQGAAVDLDGERVTDDGPVLKAVETLLKIQERRSKLWGADAPAKAAVEVTTVNYSIDGVDTEQV